MDPTHWPTYYTGRGVAQASGLMVCVSSTTGSTGRLERFQEVVVDKSETYLSLCVTNLSFSLILKQ